MFKNQKIVDITHKIMREKINIGDTVVDGTCGNGYDMIFLGSIVGEKGLVWGFDSHENAIERTLETLQKENLTNYKLIKDSYANINKHITEKIRGGILNLGYLPLGDMEITSTEEGIIMALKSMLDLLDENGIIVATSYYGHMGGVEELTGVKKYLENLPEKYLVTKLDFVNRENISPTIYVIEN